MPAVDVAVDMKPIHRQTRIATIIAADGRVIETLIALSPRFKKLRNPVLRKVMAGQVTVAMAARIAGLGEEQILLALQKLGLPVKLPDSRTHGEGRDPASEQPRAGGRSGPAGTGWPGDGGPGAGGYGVEDEILSENPGAATARDIYAGLPSERITFLDVRPMMERGQEPLSAILDVVPRIAPGEGLCIVNSFPPEPLLPLLAHKGLTGYIVSVDGHYEARFVNSLQSFASAAPSRFTDRPSARPSGNRAEDSRQAFAEPVSSADNQGMEPMAMEVSLSKSVVIRMDVRGGRPPGPMIRIMGCLEQMKPEQVLYVFHDRMPRFLLPQLVEAGYSYRISERGPQDVRILIGRQR